MDPKKIMRLSAIISICIFFIITYLVSCDMTSGFDDPIRHFFYDLRCTGLTYAAIILTNAANKYTIIAFCLALLIIPKTRMTFGIPLSAGSLGTIIINHSIKAAVGRPRPDAIHLVAENGFSFPSGHSISSMFFYGLALWLIYRYVPSEKAKIPLMIAAAIPMIFVGPTRIYLGVHYPTDVLGGWCLGFAAIAVTIEIIDKVSKKRAISP